MSLNKLKDLREDHDLLQKDIAELLNMKQQQYSNYERGLYDLPVKYLLQLAEFYHTTTDYILGRSSLKTDLDFETQEEEDINSVAMHLKLFKCLKHYSLTSEEMRVFEEAFIALSKERNKVKS